MELPLLLATDADRLLRAAALPRVRLRSLSADRKVSPVAKAPVRADLHQPLDVQADLATEVALDLVLAIDDLAEAVDLLLGEVAHARVGRHVRGADDLGGRGGADAVDVGEADDHPLLAGDVDAGDTSHGCATPAAACAWG